METAQRSSRAATTRRLTAEQVEAFNRNGYHFPLRVMSAEEAAGYRRRLEEFEAQHGLIMKTAYRNKPHLVFKWVNQLIRHPGIVDAIEDLLGPDLLVWGSSFFIKEPHDPAYISWHQDSTYWGLSHPDIVTAWVAFSVSDPANGAMRVVPGSHLKDQLPHRDTFAQNNLLTRGQEVMVEVDERTVVDMTLQPGEMSLHHVRMVHGSEPNRADYRRIGLAIRYVPTYVRQTAGPKDYATLVRGVDRYRHFEYEPVPKVEFGEEERAAHRLITEEANRILYRGTDRAPGRG
ncbi:MAG TPA: phytanoyl-CoA dioxygenase family protein [Burkholderiales bacterium]|jgi:non-heme Fe2+,alpha-ketoglutarate-dependent halogenase|nr:phytanoyl-CoA dioxygenase family protein [Burkholderiales bacterium]